MFGRKGAERAGQTAGDGGGGGGGGGCHYKPAADTSARFGSSPRADANDYLFCGAQKWSKKKVEGEFIDKIKMHILHW